MIAKGKTILPGRPSYILLALVMLFLTVNSSYSQTVTVSGTVYDITKKLTIESVSVISTSGKGTVTDSFGRYSITVKENDSIYFSYLNKTTPKYAVKNIPNLESFNISIQKRIGELPSIFVKQRVYKFDSLQNRKDYEKIFNYKKPGVGVVVNPGMAVGLDLDQFINMFSFRKNRRMVAFQQRLLREEQEGFISHRFNKGLVRKLTGLTSPELDSFMVEFRPTYDMVQQFNDLELGQFVVEAYKYFKAGIKIDRRLFRRENQYDLINPNSY